MSRSALSAICVLNVTAQSESGPLIPNLMDATTRIICDLLRSDVHKLIRVPTGFPSLNKLITKLSTLVYALRLRFALRLRYSLQFCFTLQHRQGFPMVIERFAWISVLESLLEI